MPETTTAVALLSRGRCGNVPLVGKHNSFWITIRNDAEKQLSARSIWAGADKVPIVID